MQTETVNKLRARVLYYYAAAKFARGQTETALSPRPLAELLEVPEADERTIEPLAEALEGRLECRWLGGRFVMAMPADTAALDDSVARVLNHWQACTGRTGTLHTASRKRCVAARLREGYTEAQLCSAAEALAESPHHRGENPQRVRYDDVMYFAGSTERLDRWLSATPEGIRATGEDRMASARAEATARRARRRKRTT